MQARYYLDSKLIAAMRWLGFDIHRRSLAHSGAVRLGAMLRNHGINLVLDVGANVGQFGRELRDNYSYTERIVSFEPLQAAHAVLSADAAKDPLWDVAPVGAIGASDGEVEINVAANSVSSSILPMLESHSSVAPHSRRLGVEKVPLRRLDTVAADYIDERSVIFLKIDTQGYERQVLDGASRILPRLMGIHLELSLVPLYAGQQLMPELIKFMDHAGFDLWDISSDLVDPSSGRVLQFNATFFRRQDAARPCAWD
ncbi:MAG: FkbM family methyltransferase [Nevskia sp.]|nr:FkbM family methyltransferase [Nevskia sp.]